MSDTDTDTITSLPAKRPPAGDAPPPAASVRAPPPRPGLRRAVANPRDIINRKALILTMDQAVEDNGHGEACRTAWHGILKQALDDGRTVIEARLAADRDGSACVAGTCHLVDQILRVLFDALATRFYPAANPTEGEKLCLVATGGYGRGELAPWSDIDILFLHHYKRSARIEQIVEDMLYMCWDLKLKVGQAIRTVDDCLRLARDDWTICTSLLETRYICGERRYFRDLKRRFRVELQRDLAAEFLDAKLEERERRHARTGNTRYVLEPDVKDGKGGLRDLQALQWMAKFYYTIDDIADLPEPGIVTRKEFDRFAKAQHYLWTLRCHLHYLAGRPEERLTFDLQPEVARRMNYKDHAGSAAVERFMKHYFLVARDVGDLTRSFIAAFDMTRKRRSLFSLPTGFFRRDIDGFRLEDARLHVTGKGHFAARPVDMLRIFKVAHERGVKIHPAAFAQIARSLRLIDGRLRADAEANAIFLDILTARKEPDTILRQMNECGVIGRFVPDFGRVVAQMQYDMYHVYTTDEHTIRAIGILNRIEIGDLPEEHPVCTEAMRRLRLRRALYVAVLLHDIAKGRGGDHSRLGEEIALRLCPRLGLDEEETGIVAWLVRHHLAMSRVAFKRDLDDPKTITDFVALVQSPERLLLLVCLTVCDIKAVGPNVWNNWKANLLRELFWRARDAMAGGMVEGERPDRIAAVRDEVGQCLKADGWSDAGIAAHLALCPDACFLSGDVHMLARQAHVARAAMESGGGEVRVFVDKARAVSEVAVCCPNAPGLVAGLAGALSVVEANVVDARISTLRNGMALDGFLIQDHKGAAFADPDRLQRLETLIRRTLSGQETPACRRPPGASESGAFYRRRHVFKVNAAVLIDNRVSNTHSVIEVMGRDRPGLLFSLTAALNDLNLHIATAKISTYGEKVVDVFYVKDMYGLKITGADRQSRIRARLTAALTGDGSGAEPGPATATETVTATVTPPADRPMNPRP